MIYFVTKVEIKKSFYIKSYENDCFRFFCTGRQNLSTSAQIPKICFFSYELIYNEFGSQLSQQSTSMDEQLMCQVSDIFETPKNVFWMNFKISNL